MNLYNTPRRAAEVMRALRDKIQILKLGRRSLAPVAQFANLLPVAD